MISYIPVAAVFTGIMIGSYTMSLSVKPIEYIITGEVKYSDNFFNSVKERVHNWMIKWVDMFTPEFKKYIGMPEK
jgi:hypothetical protein